jgi:inositol transporter-like SP family MFS transporter
MSSQQASTRKAPNPWWVGVVSGMASYIDSAAIVSNGIAIVIYQQAIGLDATQIGILSGGLTLCIAIGALVGGRLGDRFGRRSVFMVTMAMVALGSALQVFAPAFGSLLVGVILVGLGTGADLPVSLANISEAADDKNRGAIVGLSNLLWTIGIITTIVISSVAGGWGRLGGQLLYGHVGVVALILLLLRIALPESPVWLKAREERRQGIQTVRADRVRVGDLLKGDYAKPFIALLVFYTLTNAGANTNGQFSTYIAVNVAGIPVATYSQLSLAVFPIGLLAGIWFMKIVDTPRRMTYFAVGAVGMLLSYLIPAIIGFTMATMIISTVLGGVGAAFAFEGVMKVWTQESFPTMLRSTAQGSIVAVARVVAALLAVVTPGLINAGAQAVYLILFVVEAIGLGVGWWVFHNRTRNEFHTEAQIEDGAETESQPA